MLRPLVGWLSACCAAGVTISNARPRVDGRTGAILELGDGSLAKFGSRYYLYGVKYRCTPSPVGPTQGCVPRGGDRRIWSGMSIGVASSADLVSWRVESYDAIPEMHQPSASYPASQYAWFMPTIVHNGTHYALWYYIDDYARGVAVSSSPAGPFAIVHHCVPNLQLGSDFFFWTAPDGIYMKHNGGCAGDGAVVSPGEPCPTAPVKRGQGICVAKLSNNLTDIAESSRPIQAPGEGGGIFEREGRWYIMQGHGCCFCKCGDDAQVFESSSGPYGPYQATNNIINCSLPDYHAGRDCGGPNSPKRGPGAQQFGVFAIPLAGNKTAHLWVGIRFGSAPDGLKCHEWPAGLGRAEWAWCRFQYWDALKFDQQGHVLPLEFKDSFVLDIPTNN